MPYTEAEEHWLNHQYRLFDEAFLSVSIGEEILQVKWSILMYCSVSNLEIIYFKIVCVCLCFISFRNSSCSLWAFRCPGSIFVTTSQLSWREWKIFTRKIQVKQNLQQIFKQSFFVFFSHQLLKFIFANWHMKCPKQPECEEQAHKYISLDF